MSRVVVPYFIAILLLTGTAAMAQSQSSQGAQSKGQSSKPASSSSGPSTSNNPDDLLNAPMTPPRSTTEGAKPAQSSEPGQNPKATQDSKASQTSKPAGEEFPFPEDEEKGNYSSSKDTQGDLSAPPGDASHPGADLPDANGDVTEMEPWNPHKADKDVEVGTFYFKRGNYKAAEARFRDALKWDRNHAEANYRLAAVLDKEGRRPEAAIYYEAYLKILPSGEFADRSRKALTRIDSGDTSKSGKKPITSPPS